LWLRFMQKHLPGKLRNSRILEIGCAYGYYLKALHQLRNEVYGLDISAYAIGRAQEEVLPERADALLCQSAEDPYPFPDDFFDLIFSLDTIEHLARPEAMLGECQRTLKAGGVLVVVTPNRRSDVWVRFLFGPDRDLSHVNIRSAEEWLPAFAQHFDLVHMEYKNFESVTAPRWYLRCLAGLAFLFLRPLRMTHHLVIFASKGSDSRHL